MLTRTTFQKELIPLRGKKIHMNHTHKTGFWHLYGVPFRIFDDHPINFLWDSTGNGNLLRVSCFYPLPLYCHLFTPRIRHFREIFANHLYPYLNLAILTPIPIFAQKLSAVTHFRLQSSTSFFEMRLVLIADQTNRGLWGTWLRYLLSMRKRRAQRRTN